MDNWGPDNFAEEDEEDEEEQSSSDIMETKNLHDTHFSQMNDFRKSNKYCDLDIIIGNKTFPCHRVVLASASSYFDKLLDGSFVESKQRQITCDSVNAACFENVLEFVYVKETKICKNNAYDLLTASRYLNLDALKDTCVTYLTTHLPSEQIFETCTYAYLTDEEELYDECLDYIIENFETLSKERKFLNVPFEVLHEITLKRNSLPHDLILDLIIRWKNAGNGDESHMTKLLGNVESGDITCDYLAKLILKAEHIQSLNICGVCVADDKHTLKQFTYQDTDEKWTQHHSPIAQVIYKKRLAIQENIFTLTCSGWSSCEDERVAINEFVVDSLCPTSTQCLKQPPASVSSFLLSAIRNLIYLHVTDFVPKRVEEVSFVPKTRNLEKSISLFSYVHDLDEWFAVPKPEVDVIRSSMVTMDYLLYLVGGCKCSVEDSESRVGSMAQCYDHRMPSWIVLPEMSYSHYNGAACSFKGKLYVLGGDGGRVLEVFDPTAGRWETLMAPLYDHSSFSFVEYRNKLWAIGNGTNKKVVVEYYFPELDIWTDKSSPALLMDYEMNIVDTFLE